MLKHWKLCGLKLNWMTSKSFIQNPASECIANKRGLVLFQWRHCIWLSWFYSLHGIAYHVTCHITWPIACVALHLFVYRGIIIRVTFHSVFSLPWCSEMGFCNAVILWYLVWLCSCISCYIVLYKPVYCGLCHVIFFYNTVICPVQRC